MSDDTFSDVASNIHIGALATKEEVPTWNWLWPQSTLNFTAWEEGTILNGTEGNRCAYMNVNTGLWGTQDCGEETAFVCEKAIGEEFQNVNVPVEISP